MVNVTRRSRIVLLNGTSSSGKSTIAAKLRPALGPTFCYYASDQLADAGFRPPDPETRWTLRENFFRGFHRSIAAFADAGNDLLVEHIVEQQSWAEELHDLLRPFDMFWVGVHAPVEEIDRRERLRGDRTIGEGRFHLGTHAFCRYDLEVDSTGPADEVVRRIVLGWQQRAEV